MKNQPYSRSKNRRNEEKKKWMKNIAQMVHGTQFISYSIIYLIHWSYSTLWCRFVSFSDDDDFVRFNPIGLGQYSWFYFIHLWFMSWDIPNFIFNNLNQPILFNWCSNHIWALRCITIAWYWWKPMNDSKQRWKVNALLGRNWRLTYNLDWTDLLFHSIQWKRTERSNNICRSVEGIFLSNILPYQEVSKPGTVNILISLNEYINETNKHNLIIISPKNRKHWFHQFNRCSIYSNGISYSF